MQLKREQQVQSRQDILTTDQRESELRQKPPNKKVEVLLFVGGLLAIAVLGAIAAAVALPSLLSCGNKAVQAVARNNIGAMNRAQQAHFIDKKVFANSIQDLGLGIKTLTANYEYSTRTNALAVFNYGSYRYDTKKSYVGAVFAVPGSNDERVTVAILCEGKSPKTKRLAEPTYQNGVLACGSDAIKLGE